MINLIPPEGHKALKREYYARVFSTAAILFGAVFLLLTVAYIPTYVLINAQIDVLKAETLAGERREDIKSAEAEVAQVQKLLGQLALTASEMRMSNVIEEVEKVAPQGVSFRNFVVDRGNGKIESITVQGVSPTRSILAQFKKSIEDTEMFTSAEVPIADLARESNLPFNVRIMLAEPKK